MAKKRIIICISREYGSGGAIIGKMLAQELGIPYYDKELLVKAAQDHGLSKDILEIADEKPATWASMGFPMGLRNPDKPDYDAVFYSLNDKIFSILSQTIKTIAAEGSSVIVGRLAEQILDDDPDLISIFVHARLEDRIKRIMAVEKIDEHKAAQLIRKSDQNRSNYSRNYSKRKWGFCTSYDLAISSSKFGLDGTVKAILRIIES